MSLIPFVGALQKFNRQRGGYQIERSLRFNSADTAYLNRTPASSGNLDAWTFSAWVKRSKIGISTTIFSAQSDTNNWMYIGFLSGDTLTWQQADAASVTMTLTTSQLFRDVGSWYHIVCKYDSAQATAADRQEIYINGIKVTAFGTATRLGLNVDSRINRNIAHQIGRYISAANYFNGYLTEINFIDGSTPATTTRVVNGVTQTILTEFGEFNEDTGVWQPIEYTGTYGTNGFYLNFSDNSTADALGTDFSGNDNTWDDNGISVTAGVDNDSLVDSPTNYGTDTGAGGEVRGNYCTLNALWKNSAWSPTNGNLTANMGSGTNGYVALGSFAMPAGEGKWYFEIVFTSGSPSSANQQVGIVPISGSYAATQVANADISNAYSTTNGYAYNAGGTKNSPAGRNATYTGAASWGVNDVVGVAYDASAGTLTFYKNGVSQGQAFSGITTSEGFYPAIADYAGLTVNINFGQRPFAYTAPSGFKALCTQNLPESEATIPNGREYFDVDVYTGIAGTYTKSGLDFQPDLIWGKARNAAAAHRLVDAVRGGTLKLTTSSTDAENTDVAPYTFTSDGYSIPGGVNHNNNTGTTYVSWLWKANGAGVTNTDGTITSTVSANPDAGFSIVTFNIPASGTSDTIGHGLGVAPSMVILKPRTAGTSWGVYHSGLTSAAYYLTLQTTNAQALSNNWWNSTAPTSSVFTIGATWYGTTNAVAYCFAAIPGYSAFGSYTGNGSADGSFIYTGFRPRWVMLKRTDGVAGWVMFDTARDPYNVMQLYLYANLSNAEATAAAQVIDILSNGFKMRGTDSYINGSGATYIYMAFAENPFKYSLAR